MAQTVTSIELQFMPYYTLTDVINSECADNVLMKMNCLPTTLDN